MTKQEVKLFGREEDNTIRIESKPVVLPAKRQSAMRPGTIPVQMQRQPQMVHKRKGLLGKSGKHNFSPNSDGVPQKIFEVTHGDDEYLDNYDLPHKNS